MNLIQKTFSRIKAVMRMTQKLLLEPVIGYTRIVFAAKYLLASIAGILALVLIIFSLYNPVQDNFKVTFSNISGLTSEQPKMINPRFQGVDNDNQTYNISADSATKLSDFSVSLENINADINLKDGEWIALLATKGVYNHIENKIEMTELVNIFTSEGYELTSQAINMNLKERSAESSHKVKGQGPGGTIIADRFSISDNGNLAVFEGNVKMILFVDKIKSM